MDDTYQEYLAHLKKANPLHWASLVLGELRGWMSKQTDCKGALHLELPEKRREIAEAVSLALEEINGKTVLGISDGETSLLVQCRAEEKEFILEQIGEHIKPDTRYILVNISDGDDIAITGHNHSPDVERAVFLMWGMLGHLRHKNDPTGLLRLDDEEHRMELAEALRVVLHELTQCLGIQDVTEITHE